MSRIHYKNYSGITLLARDLRKNQTIEEDLLWKELRRRRFSGYKFLRQHPVFYRIDKGWVEFFIADFYCRELKLIIELDGAIHSRRKEYDKERDEKLNSKGLKVIRIKNESVHDTGKFLEILKLKISEITSNVSINQCITTPSLNV
jgi:very-short-patch-repair endonuclease